jgi:hypothetical protein
MKRIALIGLVLTGLMAPSGAQALTLVEPPHPLWPYQQWVQAALVPLPEQTVWLHQSSRPCGAAGASACTDGESIWLIPDREARLSLLHEVGNLVSPTVPLETRARFQELSGDAGAWTTDTAGSGANYDFASSYAYCAWPVWEARPEMHFFRIWPHMKAICALIRSL